MTNEFMVIGEHRENSDELLVKGADGQYYEYDLTREQVSRVDLGDQWELFPDAMETTEEFTH